MPMPPTRRQNTRLQTSWTRPGADGADGQRATVATRMVRTRPQCSRGLAYHAPSAGAEQVNDRDGEADGRVQPELRCGWRRPRR